MPQTGVTAEHPGPPLSAYTMCHSCWAGRQKYNNHTNLFASGANIISLSFSPIWPPRVHARTGLQAKQEVSSPACGTAVVMAPPPPVPDDGAARASGILSPVLARVLPSRGAPPSGPFRPLAGRSTTAHMIKMNTPVSILHNGTPPRSFPVPYRPRTHAAALRHRRWPQL